MDYILEHRLYGTGESGVIRVIVPGIEPCPRVRVVDAGGVS